MPIVKPVTEKSFSFHFLLREKVFLMRCRLHSQICNVDFPKVSLDCVYINIQSCVICCHLAVKAGKKREGAIDRVCAEHITGVTSINLCYLKLCETYRFHLLIPPTSLADRFISHFPSDMFKMEKFET